MPKKKAKTFDPDELLFDLYAMSREEVDEIFWDEVDSVKPNFEKIKFMIDSGLVEHVEYKKYVYEYETPLHELCLHRKNLELVEFLLDKGADDDIDAMDEDGHTPLHYACWYDNFEIAKLLIKRGADVNAENRWGLTPLHWACKSISPKCVAILLDNDADLSVADSNGERPFDYAQKNDKILKIFHNKGCNHYGDWDDDDWDEDEEE
jgi:hypothetical protein